MIYNGLENKNILIERYFAVANPTVAVMSKYVTTIIITLILLSLTLSFTGCQPINKIADLIGVSSESSASSESSFESEISETSETPSENISFMLDEIYENCDIMGVEIYDASKLENMIGITSDQVEEFFVACTNGKFGVADVAVIKPVDSARGSIIEALRSFLEKRAESFENYDVNDAVSTCLNGKVYSENGYIVMVAFRDNDTISEIISKYID